MRKVQKQGRVQSTTSTATKVALENAKQQIRERDAAITELQNRLDDALLENTKLKEGLKNVRGSNTETSGVSKGDDRENVEPRHVGARLAEDSEQADEASIHGGAQPTVDVGGTSSQGGN